MTAAQLSLSEEQISAYKKMIELNPPGWEGAISDVKSAFPDLASINPLSQEQLDKFSISDKVKRLKQLEEYKKPYKKCVEPLSPNIGKLLAGADPCKNNFFDNVDVSLKNFFNKVTAIDGAGLNLSSEIQGVVGEIANASTAFTGQITNALSDGLVDYVKGGLSGIATKTFAEYAAAGLPQIAAVAKITSLQEGLVEPTGAMFSGFDCLASKVTDALSGTLEDMITGMIKNVTNVPTCAVQEFTGAIAGKINKEIDSIMTPLINPISKSLMGLGVGGIFDVKDFISSGVDTISKASDLFKCGGGPSCVSSSVYKMGVGLVPTRSNAQQQSFVDKALSLGSKMTDGVADKIGDFEDAYGQWSIFGTQVGTPSGLEPCNTTNIFNCGPPRVEFFGGDGSGSAGEVILGKFIDKLDVDDIFGSFSRTASIAGVRVTKPGSGYTEAPLIAFTDSCGQGYGAFGRAIIDQNQNSPSFGQVIDVAIISEGENYPVAEYTTGGGGVQDLFISKVIVDEPGSGYQKTDIIADENLSLIVDDNGAIAGVDVVSQVPFDLLPIINIKTTTGSGAVLRPVMAIQRSTREERLVQVIDCILPKRNYQVTDIGTSNLVGYVDGQPYYGDFHIMPNGIKMTGLTHSGDDRIIYDTPEISTSTLVETPVDQITGYISPQTNVSSTTTETTTSSTTQTNTTSNTNQQTTGQSNTSVSDNTSSNSGSSGTGGSGYGGGY